MDIFSQLTAFSNKHRLTYSPQPPPPFKLSLEENSLIAVCACVRACMCVGSCVLFFFIGLQGKGPEIEQQTFILSEFYVLEIKNQGITPDRAQRESLFNTSCVPVTRRDLCLS